MYLNDGDITFLLLNALFIASLGICLVLLLFPRFRRRSNPFAWIIWINLAAGLLYYAQYPVKKMQEAAFARSDPGYGASDAEFSGRSLYIPDTEKLNLATYSCYGGFSASTCTAPLSKRIKEGTLDFVELGTNPIIRYQIEVGHPACLDWDLDMPDELADRFTSPGLAACIVGEKVPTADADHILTIEKKSLSWPSKMPYFHASLIQVATGDVVDQFDGWNGATPYLLREKPKEARRPDQALARLLTIPFANQKYDRKTDDRLLKKHSFDEATLIQAIQSPYQSIRARTLWLACRDEIVAALSSEARSTLRSQSTTVFEASPDWRYPDNCPAWAR